MSFKDNPDILNCLDEYEESPLKRFNNLQVLRMKALRLGEIDEDEHKIVNQMASGDLALMRIGVEDKQASADSEIAMLLAQQMSKMSRPVDRVPGTGTQPSFDNTDSIDSFVITEQAMRLSDSVAIEDLGLTVD